ncbi:MAG: histidine--tRNA ligase [Candidatus Uhrbacteria bacterium]
MRKQLIEPTLPSGFRDYLPSEAIVRSRMLSIIRSTFERYGFDSLETPGVERREVLTGNDLDFKMILYDAQTSIQRRGGDEPDTALRFDLTVPLARVVAAHSEIRRPFKRFQIGTVWRGERPQSGRYREFLQCDIDIVGSASPLADAEIVACMIETFRALNVPRFKMRINNRKILNGLASYAGFDPVQIPVVLRVIDKFRKIGRDAVLRELGKPLAQNNSATAEGEEAEESATGLGLSASVVERIGSFLDLSGSTDELLDRVANLFRGVAVAEDGVGELRAIVSSLRSMGIPEEHWILDHSIARGLGYYTGPVFETYLSDLPAIGSVCSGGRYDGLVARFSNQAVPATGASIGIDRLCAALTELHTLESPRTIAEAFVAIMDEAGLPDALAAAGELRAAGIRTILWLGDGGFKEQLAYAVAQEIPAVVIIGSDERSAGTVTVRNMRAREQQTIPRAQLTEMVRNLLAK